MLRYFTRGGIKPRAGFESAAESRAYADRAFCMPMVGQWTAATFGAFMVVNTIDSLRDTDPMTHPTPLSLCLLAAELLTIQFLNNRAETASDRAHETNAEFSAARNAELEGQSPHDVEWARTEVWLDGIRAQIPRQPAEPSEAQQKSLQYILSHGMPNSQEAAESPPTASSSEVAASSPQDPYGPDAQPDVPEAGQQLPAPPNHQDPHQDT